MQTFAAIDIGSNSCRLKIGRVVQHRLRIVHEDREVTRLGGSVFETGIVSPEAMAATLRTLKRFHKAVQLHGTDKVRAVATSAMRDARNSRAFQAWVRDETGWDVEIISGLEEARLIHRGVMGEPGTQGRCLLIDVGGGSRGFGGEDSGRLGRAVRGQRAAGDAVDLRLRARWPRIPTAGLCADRARRGRPDGPGGAARRSGDRGSPWPAAR